MTTPIERIANIVMLSPSAKADIQFVLQEVDKEAYERGKKDGARDVIGELGAKLLARHSTQNVLDAYFDVANEELEKYETDD